MMHLCLTNEEATILLMACRSGRVMLKESTESVLNDPGPMAAHVVAENAKMSDTIKGIEGRLEQALGWK